MYVGNRPLSAIDPLGLVLVDEAIESRVSITFGHGARHLAGTRLSQVEVEVAIEATIRELVATGGVSGGFWLKVEVSGMGIIARAYMVTGAWINVNTYYPLYSLMR